MFRKGGDVTFLVEEMLAEHFQAKGGRLAYIPCLNDAPEHAQALAQLARRAAGCAS